MDEHMIKTIDTLRGNFDEKMHGLKVQVGGDISRMKEEVVSLQKRIE